MPRKIIHELQQDVARLLQVGAGAIASDEGLRVREASLSAVAVKVSAFAPLVAQVAKLRSAEPRQASIELLQLSAMLNVVRASLLTTHEISAALAPIPATRLLTSRSSNDEVTRLQVMLQNHHFPADELARPELFDARLISSWLVAALHRDKAEEYWDFIKENLPGVSFFLSRDLRLDGDETDALRLRLLAHIEGEAVMPLLERAFEEGSEAVQNAAFTSKVCLAPLAHEDDVFKAFSEPYIGRRLVAVYCMCYLPTKRACQALLSLLFLEEGYSQMGRLSRAAAYSLAGSRYPEVRQELISALLANKEEVSLQPFIGLFQRELSEDVSRSLLALWRRYQKVLIKLELAKLLAQHGTASVLSELFREMPSISHAPNVILQNLSPRLANSGELFLDPLFALLDKFSVSDRDMLYRELIDLNAHSAVRERLMQRARTVDLSHREKNILQTTFEEIRRLQRSK